LLKPFLESFLKRSIHGRIFRQRFFKGLEESLGKETLAKDA